MDEILFDENRSNFKLLMPFVIRNFECWKVHVEYIWCSLRVEELCFGVVDEEIHVK